MPDGGIATTFTDITPSVEAAEALERANETLERRVRERTEELTRRYSALEAQGGYRVPVNQTPWQAIHRATVGQLETGGVIEQAIDFQRLAQTTGGPRHNH